MADLLDYSSVVFAQRADGTRVYYTGRTDAAFVSPHRVDAFAYTFTAACRRVDMLNRGTEIHGLHFDHKSANAPA